MQKTVPNAVKRGTVLIFVSNRSVGSFAVIVDKQNSYRVGSAMGGYGAARGRFQYLVENSPRADDFRHLLRQAVVHLGVSDKAAGFIGSGTVALDPLGIFFDTTFVASHRLGRDAHTSVLDFDYRLDLQQIAQQNHSMMEELTISNQ